MFVHGGNGKFYDIYVLSHSTSKLQGMCHNFFLYPAFTTLYEFEPPHSRGSEITHKEAPQSVGLLWTSDQLVAETST
jgi:hypothetical protein